MIKALQCPFCGAPQDSPVEFQIGTRDREGFPKSVVCVECGAAGPLVYVKHEDDEVEVIEEWNNRV
jgi:Lar family restriction alleviation protein